MNTIRSGHALPARSPLELPPRNPRRTAMQLIGWGLFFLIIYWGWIGAEIKPLELLNSRENIATLANDFLRPNFEDWRLYLHDMAITMDIAVWGTLLSIICAVPLGLLCSGNVAPVWVTFPTRRLMDALRAINEFVFALLFVAAVGLGPFAGMLAIFVHTTGVLAKLFSEAVEAIDPRPVEGIRATGASKVEEIVYGVIPQVIPLWVSYALYRFETNVRSATVIGIVGGGGIGFVLNESIRGFYYDRAAAIMIIIILSVSALDIISGFIRRRFI
jgi:phosphonate transport system permease protein